MKKEKISLGLHLGRGYDNQKYLINKYQDYLESIYLGPPQDLFGNDYTTVFGFSEVLQEIYGKNIDKYEKDILSIVDYARERDIKINFTLNKIDVQKDSFSKVVPFIKKLNPEQICTRTEYLSVVKKEFPDKFYVRTFYDNEFPCDDNENSDFQSYVVRNTYFWNHILMKRNQHRIMINNACPLTCPGCIAGNENHERWLIYEFKDMETYLAKHAWGREDIKLFKETFPNINYSIKIGTRIKTDSTHVDRYINSLITGSIIDFINRGLGNFAISYSGLYPKNIENRYDYSKFDYDKFYQKKIEWWKQINPSINKYKA